MYSSPISPAPCYPGTADTLRVDSFNSIPPNYRWSIGYNKLLSPGSAAVVALGLPGDKDYSPAITAVDPTYQYVELAAGNGSITKDQWNDWTTDADDSLYCLSCVAANLVPPLKLLVK